MRQRERPQRIAGAKSTRQHANKLGKRLAALIIAKNDGWQVTKKHHPSIFSIEANRLQPFQL